ncbi:hypothetical protein Tco_0562653 [Tanacetum coccineum]
MCSSCKVFGHVLDECPNKIVSDVGKNLKTLRQAARGVKVGPKKQAELSSQNVSNSNPFDALNSVEDDDDLGTNVRNLKSAGNGSLKVARGSSSNTPIIEKIDKLERQILDGKLMLVDDDGKPLYKVVSKGNVDSDSEVEVVFDKTANLMASTSLKGGSENGYGTNSLLEQWRETILMMTTTRMTTILMKVMICLNTFKAICDNFDITVHGARMHVGSEDCICILIWFRISVIGEMSFFLLVFVVFPPRALFREVSMLSTFITPDLAFILSSLTRTCSPSLDILTSIHAFLAFFVEAFTSPFSIVLVV